MPYRLERFDPASAAPGEGYARAAARALGVDPASVFKTLMVLVDDRLWCAVVPASGELDLKAMARAADGKRATMASVLQAERATGYVVGGISPLGQRRPHATVIDASAMSQAEILISAGARGLDAALAPGDLARLTRARVDCIGRAA
ncbi:MAG: aminoacyl-tRNA deacylase [Bifidobacteriaceae bacterium]|nr:aminoacyl-tRNA deacylase [Bifidobacteriaceae bacterium]